MKVIPTITRAWLCIFIGVVLAHICASEQNGLDNRSVQGFRECKLTEPELNEGFNNFTQEFSRIIDILNEEIKKLSLRKEKGNDSVDGVLLIGNTGAGKSTLAQLISGDNSKLKSVEVNRHSGDYIITDGDKIGTETIISKTISPNILVDAETQIIVSDSPGFSDTRSPIYELIAASSTKEILRKIDRVKIVLVIAHPSLKIGSYREDFTNLLKQTVKLVRDVQKYKDSFYLVATKAENSFIFKKGKMIPSSDETIINGIYYFLNETRSSLANHQDFIEETTKQEIIKLIDSLMQREANNSIPSKIKIFRKPLKDGPIQELELIQAERLALREIFFEKNHFTPKNDDDFGYSISSSAQLYMKEVFSFSDQYMIGLTHQVSKYLLDNYKSAFDKLEESNQRLNLAKKIKLEINNLEIEIGNSKDPLGCFNSITKFLQTHHINFGCNLNLNNVTLLNNYLAYLENFDSYTPSRWNSSFTTVTDFIEVEIKNSHLLEEIFSILSSYNIQRRKSSIIPSLDQWEKENYLHNAINKETFLPFLKTIQLDVKYNSLKPTDYALEMINRAAYLLLKSEIKISCEKDTLYIEGFIITLSEIDYNHIKECSFKNFMVFAIHTLFIDIDLKGEEFAGKQITIVARNWDVLGTRKISVDGKSARNLHFPKAEMGEVGKNGKNGGDGGIFTGIVEVIENSHSLVISANGGDGQDGQAGGDGMDGYNGLNGVHYSSANSHKDNNIYVVYNKVINTEVLEGTRGSDGSNSGGGGRGGMPGKQGSVKLLMYGSHKSDNRVSIQMKDGVNGKKGADGRPGIGGKGGCDILQKTTKHYALFIPVSTDYSTSVGSCHSRSKNGRIISNNDYFRWGLSTITLLPLTECEIMQHYKNIYEDDYKSARFNQIIEDFINDVPC